MKQKTKVSAEKDKQEVFVEREFDLPVELLFKAFVTPKIVEQWMDTKVIKLESQNHGSFQFETTDPKGNKHGFNGTIHSLISNKHIIRTFEMEGMPFGVQLEILSFEKMNNEKSRFSKQIIYESIEKRDKNLELPFDYGINIAHNRLQETVNKLK